MNYYINIKLRFIYISEIFIQQEKYYYVYYQIIY